MTPRFKMLIVIVASCFVSFMAQTSAVAQKVASEIREIEAKVAKTYEQSLASGDKEAPRNAIQSRSQLFSQYLDGVQIEDITREVDLLAIGLVAEQVKQPKRIQEVAHRLGTIKPLSVQSSAFLIRHDLSQGKITDSVAKLRELKHAIPEHIFNEVLAPYWFLAASSSFDSDTKAGIESFDCYLQSRVELGMSQGLQQFDVIIPVVIRKLAGKPEAYPLLRSVFEKRSHDIKDRIARGTLPESAEYYEFYLRAFIQDVLAEHDTNRILDLALENRDLTGELTESLCRVSFKWQNPSNLKSRVLALIESSDSVPTKEILNKLSNWCDVELSLREFQQEQTKRCEAIDPLNDFVLLRLSTAEGMIQSGRFIYSLQTKLRAPTIVVPVGGARSISNDIEYRGLEPTGPIEAFAKNDLRLLPDVAFCCVLSKKGKITAVGCESEHLLFHLGQLTSN